MVKSGKWTIRRRYIVVSWVATLVALIPLSLRFVLRYSGSDKEHPNGHQYGKSYSRALRRWKYRAIRILEVGIGGYKGQVGGQSLLAWACYFPFAQVYGCDIEDKTILSRGRIVVRVADQSSKSDLDRIANDGPFDLIVDDGSHVNAHQIFTFENLFPKMNSGGLYIVEDVQTSYWESLGGKPVTDPLFVNTCMGYFTVLARYLNHLEFSDAANLDLNFLSLGKMIKRIQFEHNLIFVEKH